jgi:hypothetical protein
MSILSPFCRPSGCAQPPGDAAVQANRPERAAFPAVPATAIVCSSFL